VTVVKYEGFAYLYLGTPYVYTIYWAERVKSFLSKLVGNFVASLAIICPEGIFILFYIVDSS